MEKAAAQLYLAESNQWLGCIKKTGALNVFFGVVAIKMHPLQPVSNRWELFNFLVSSEELVPHYISQREKEISLRFGSNKSQQCLRCTALMS